MCRLIALSVLVWLSAIGPVHAAMTVNMMSKPPVTFHRSILDELALLIDTTAQSVKANHNRLTATGQMKIVVLAKLLRRSLADESRDAPSISALRTRLPAMLDAIRRVDTPEAAAILRSIDIGYR
jgi:hypothetical protein